MLVDALWDFRNRLHAQYRKTGAAAQIVVVLTLASMSVAIDMRLRFHGSAVTRYLYAGTCYNAECPDLCALVVARTMHALLRQLARCPAASVEVEVTSSVRGLARLNEC